MSEELDKKEKPRATLIKQPKREVVVEKPAEPAEAEQKKKKVVVKKKKVVVKKPSAPAETAAPSPETPAPEPKAAPAAPVQEPVAPRFAARYLRRLSDIRLSGQHDVFHSLCYRAVFGHPAAGKGIRAAGQASIL